MALLQQFLLSLSFFTRIPLPKGWNPGTGTLAQSAWAFPRAGAVTGARPGAVYLIFLAVGLAHGIAAWAALAFLVLLTGGLHEDGLADMTDGLASGRNREQKLAIMRDSRIGSYGVLALVITLAIRASAIAGFMSEFKTVWVLITAGACSRACLAVLMHFLPNARTDGLSASAGTPTRAQTLAAVLLAIGTLLLLGNLHAALIGVLVLAAACFIINRIALKQFGGITGDVLGALQQVSETSLLVVLNACLLPA